MGTSPEKSLQRSRKYCQSEPCLTVVCRSPKSWLHLRSRPSSLNLMRTATDVWVWRSSGRWWRENNYAFKLYKVSRRVVLYLNPSLTKTDFLTIFLYPSCHSQLYYLPLEIKTKMTSQCHWKPGQHSKFFFTFKCLQSITCWIYDYREAVAVVKWSVRWTRKVD